MWKVCPAAGQMGGFALNCKTLYLHKFVLASKVSVKGLNGCSRRDSRSKSDSKFDGSKNPINNWISDADR